MRISDWSSDVCSSDPFKSLVVTQDRGGSRGIMSRKFFGTDGIRGRTNAWPMTAELAMKIGMAAGAHFKRGTPRHGGVIGKATRIAGDRVKKELGAGVPRVGMAGSEEQRGGKEG